MTPPRLVPTPVASAARPTVLRRGSPDDATAIHALIARHESAGHLLPRGVEELTVHAPRFLIVEDADGLLACAELTPLGPAVAEIRSLVVERRARGLGIGRKLVDQLLDEARRAGFGKVCAFTHQPAYFARLGFSLVPHSWVPEKIASDCASCALFRRCGQSAMERPLDVPAVRRGHARAVA